MFKEYIINIVKEQIDHIRLENTLKQPLPKTYWEEYFKAQLKHTETLVKGRDKEIYKLKETIEKLEGKSILKDNIILELKKENEILKQDSEEVKIRYNKILEEIEKLDGKLILKDNLLSEQKQVNKKLKNILNEIHEICFSIWGAPLPYCEVRRLLNVIREISKIG